MGRPFNPNCSKCGRLKTYKGKQAPDGSWYLYCSYCKTANSIRWQKANPERTKEIAARQRKLNPRKDTIQQAANHRRYKLKNKYGITPEQYNEMYRLQGGLCAICGLTETRKTGAGGISLLTIDHNHVTGKVRQLLCHVCNLGIGCFKDNPDLMSEAITYILRNQDKFKEIEVTYVTTNRLSIAA